MIYGYCRVSTQMQAKDGNSLEAQKQLLIENGAEEIYSDAFTGTKAHRPELDKLLAVLQSGDKLVITKLDRIARSASQGIELVQSLLNRGITVHVLNMGLLDNTPTGKLIRNIMLAFAEFERDMIIERTQEGKAIAKKQPDFREGRPRLYNRKQIQHALSLLQDHSYRQVTEMTGISKSTLIRAKRQTAQNP
jgi:DNA invertase Pin-like site-specific DNA recombinase